MYIPGSGFMRHLSEKGIKQAVADKIDETTRAVLAGIGLKEARALLRGDAPTENQTPVIVLRLNHFCYIFGPNFIKKVPLGSLIPFVWVCCQPGCLWLKPSPA